MKKSTKDVLRKDVRSKFGFTLACSDAKPKTCPDPVYFAKMYCMLCSYLFDNTLKNQKWALRMRTSELFHGGVIADGNTIFPFLTPQKHIVYRDASSDSCRWERTWWHCQRPLRHTSGGETTQANGSLSLFHKECKRSMQILILKNLESQSTDAPSKTHNQPN